MLEEEGELPSYLFNGYLSPGLQNSDYEPIFDEDKWKLALQRLETSSKPAGEKWEEENGLICLKAQDGKPCRL
jgi:hypothetical protein